YRMATGHDGSPVIVTGSASLQSSSQVTADLLCGDCEHLFSVNGEKRTIEDCCHSPSQFRLRTLLRSLRPFAPLNNGALFAPTQLPAAAIEAYRYFAASIVWRRSVGRWSGSSTSDRGRNCLGAYEEQFRRYLVGESPFPLAAQLAIFVANDEDPLPHCGL